MYITKSVASTILMGLISLLLLLAGTQVATAHVEDQSYIYLNVTETTLTGRYEAEFGDLNAVLGVDADEDGTVTEAEMQAADDRLQAYLVEHLQMSAGITSLTITPGETTYSSKNGMDYAKVSFEVTGFDSTPEAVNVTFSGMWETFGTDHEVFGLIGSNSRSGLEANEANINVIFAPDAQTQQMSLAPLPWTELISFMIIKGMWHIWLGYEHLALLIVLLIPAVLMVSQDRWVAAETLSRPLRAMATCVIAFTVAHSITFALASMGWLELRAWAVESAVALTVAFVALTLLAPRLNRALPLAVVIGGLCHGLGYTFVMNPINLEPNQMAVTLSGFNIGMLLGQIAVVLALLPVAYILRHALSRNQRLLRAGGIALLLLSLIWFEERAFDLMGPIGPMVRTLIGA